MALRFLTTMQYAHDNDGIVLQLVECDMTARSQTAKAGVMFVYNPISG